MEFEEETIETVGPILRMIGQQARLDPAWAYGMVEATAGQILPQYYRQAKARAGTAAERIALDVKLALSSGARTEDVVRLAQTCADAEQLDDALYWIGRAIEAHPEEGEYLRFKASILERKGQFERALQIAQRAARLGAEPEAIHSDIIRIENNRLAQLEETARSPDPGTSLLGYLSLYQRRRIKTADLARIFLQIIRLCAQTLRRPPALN